MSLSTLRNAARQERHAAEAEFAVRSAKAGMRALRRAQEVGCAFDPGLMLSAIVQAQIISGRSVAFAGGTQARARA